MTDSRTLDRRRFLRALAPASALGVAGCLGGGDGDPDDGTGPTTAGATTDATTTTDATATTTTDAGTTDAGTDDAGTTDTATTRTTAIHPGHDYETTEVVVRTPGGTRLGSVTAAIADTSELRYRGLSDTPSLPEDRGMLFVYSEVGEHTYVMRGMDFGIDIVYAGADGTITRIHHAPKPGPDEDGGDQRYPGRGQYVLEVNYDWTTDRGVETGDVLEFDL